MPLTPDQARRLTTWIVETPQDTDTVELSPQDDGDGPSVASPEAVTAAAAPSRPAPGVERVGNYRILGTIGRGGMGEVFIALDERLQRRVALKAIRADRRLDTEARERFLREARVLSSLDHPHICRIHDYLESDEGDYLVLELIDGAPLALKMRKMDRAEKLRVAEQIADVLATAHAAGVVHRDLKPDNVMITPAGEIKVLDFGLARLADEAADEAAAEPDEPDVAGGTGDAAPELSRTATQSVYFTRRAGVIAGTPLYMSPEQARGEIVSAASDMYSFGLMLQELFSGKRPYDDADGLEEILARAREGRTRPVEGMPRAQRELIEQLKRLEPKTRPTASEAKSRVRRIIERPRRLARRAVVAAGLALAVFAGVKYTVDLERERTQAVVARNDAEDLLTFMLGDLKDQLEPVGRLDVLDAVGDKALDYFSRLPEQDLGDDDLHRRARALALIGQVRLGEGDLDAAEEAFEESLVLATGVVERNPDHEEWIKGLGDSHFYIGNIRYIRGDLPGAFEKFNLYRGITERLVELDGENPEWQLETAYAHQNLCALHLEQGDIEAGLRESEASIAIKRRLADDDPDDPEWKRTLANALSWRATALWQLGDPEAARRVFDEELGIRVTLHEANPRHADDAFKVATCQGLLGDLLADTGRKDEALGHYRRMQQQLSELVDFDPANTKWRRERAVGHRLVAEAERSLGRVDAVVAELRAGHRILAELVELEPENEDWRVELAQFKRGLFTTAFERKRWAEAADEARAAIDLLAIAERGAAGPSLRRALANAWIGLGKALGKLGETDAALSACDTGRAVLGEAAELTAHHAWDINVLYHTVTIRLLEDAGREDEALERARELQRWVAAGAADEPDDGDRLADLVLAHRLVARVHRRLGRLDAAMAEAMTARDVATRLAARTPVRLKWRLECVAVRREFIVVAIGQGRWDDAVEAADEAMALLDSLISGDGPSPEVRITLGGIIFRRGVAVQHRDGPEQAAALFESAIDTVEAAVQSSERPAALTVKARALLRLDRRDEAAEIIKELDTTDHWNDALSELAAERPLPIETG